MGSLSSNSNIANSTVIPFNPQAGATYTLQAGDSNKVITLTNAGGCTVKGNPALLGPGFHCWIEARNNAANLITQFAAEKFFINGATTAGVNSFNLSPQNVQTAIGWDDVVHIATDGTDWHVIQGDPILTSSLALVTPALGAATATSINFGQTTLNYYGEGTWTPSVGGNATYTGQSGRYTRIGRLVQLEAILIINAIGTGSTTTVSGVPFIANGSTFNGMGAVFYFANIATLSTFLTPYITANSTSINFANATVAAATMTTAVAVWASGTRIDWLHVYTA